MKIFELLFGTLLTHTLAVRVQDKDEMGIAFNEARASVGAHGLLSVRTTSFIPEIEDALILTRDNFVNFFSPDRFDFKIFNFEMIEANPVFRKPDNWFELSITDRGKLVKKWKTEHKDLWINEENGGTFQERWSMQNIFNYDGNKFVFFGSLFSNWFPATITLNIEKAMVPFHTVPFHHLIAPEMTFLCTEHWRMFWKAVVFHADDAATRTLSSLDPKTMQKIGRESIPAFSDRTWSAPGDDGTSLKYRIVLYGNYLKYSSNEQYKAKLLATGEREIFEGNEFDSDWGIGLDAYDPLAYDRVQHYMGPIKNFQKEITSLQGKISKPETTPEDRAKFEAELLKKKDVRIPLGVFPFRTNEDHPTITGSKLTSYTPNNLLGKILMTVRDHIRRGTSPLDEQAFIKEMSHWYLINWELHQLKR